MGPHSPRNPTGRSPWVGLATRTKVGGPPRQPDAQERNAAARARFPGTAVNTKFVLIPPLQARTPDIVANTRPTPIDGPVQHLGYGDAQTIRLGCFGLPTRQR